MLPTDPFLLLHFFFENIVLYPLYLPQLSLLTEDEIHQNIRYLSDIVLL